MSMASVPIDIEAQHRVSQPPEAGDSERNEMSMRKGQSEIKSAASQRSQTLPPVPTATDQGASPEPAIPQDKGRRGTEVQGTNIHHSERDDTTRHTLTQTGQGQIQAEAQLPNLVVPNDPHVNRIPRSGGSDGEPEEKRMIGDFEGSANTLWTLYGKEAKSYDEARIQTLKDDMDGVLIFAGLFSASLTSFLGNTIQNLQANSGQQTAYYLQQNVAMLAQISRQLSSLAPEVSIPSTAPAPFPPFNPSASDIRVNAFWFMSLIFSLSAALIAILVQQWVRSYMQVFQRYSDPLKSARLRQYLHEGSEGWYMPVLAEAIPGLLHLSLFLFFVGLCDFILSINTTVGISTTVPIGICGLLYILTTFAPVIYPQSPYQNSFSGLIWFLIQKLGWRRYKDWRSSGALKPVSSNMAEGQMQLAMEETEERKGRDERAIRWLVGNLTEDAEMESFVMAIPGSFDAEWGVEVWKNVSKTMEDENKSGNRNQHMGLAMDVPVPVPGAVPPVIRRSRIRSIRNVLGTITRPIRTRTAGDSATNEMALLPVLHSPDVLPYSTAMYGQGEAVLRELSGRVAHLLETCKNNGLFANEELWRRRTRACIETTASLVCCTDAELGWFGDITRLLADIGDDQTIRESSLMGRDQLFVTRWTCLSLIAVRPILEHNALVHGNASFATVFLGQEDETSQALTRAQKLDEMFQKAWGCLIDLSLALTMEENLTEERVREILRNHESQISELERINTQVDRFKRVDPMIFLLQSSINRDTHGIITRQLPGVRFEELDSFTEPVHFRRTIEWFRDPLKLQFILPRQNLKSICSLVPSFRSLLGGPWVTDTYEEMLKNLQAFKQAALWEGHLLERQLWRLQDLRDGGGLGYMVELFFLALKQLLSTPSSSETHSTLYIGTFRAITAHWSKYKHSVGTQKVFLDLVTPTHGVMSDFDYPAYITDELFILLGNILEGQTGPHIDNVVQQLAPFHRFRGRAGRRGYLAKGFEVITHARAPSS